MRGAPARGGLGGGEREVMGRGRGGGREGWVCRRPAEAWWCDVSVWSGDAPSLGAVLLRGYRSGQHTSDLVRAQHTQTPPVACVQTTFPWPGVRGRVCVL